MTFNRSIGMAGTVTAKVVRGTQNVGLGWKLRNAWRLLPGLAINWLAKQFSRITHIPTITAELSAVLVRADGVRVSFGRIAARVVTSAGVGFLVDDWDDDTTDITNMNYHACGTDNTAESSDDTALGAEATTITDRATGAKTQPAANQLQSQATQTFTNTGAIVEHGLFSVVTEGAGVLWDRSVFSVINVGSGDSIQWTYTCTINAGG